MTENEDTAEAEKKVLEETEKTAKEEAEKKSAEESAASSSFLNEAKKINAEKKELLDREEKLQDRKEKLHAEELVAGKGFGGIGNSKQDNRSTEQIASDERVQKIGEMAGAQWAKKEK